MNDLVVIVLAIVVFTLAGLGYWRLVRVMAALFQGLAYLIGIIVVQSLRESEGLVMALLAGTVVYLMLFSMVMFVNRIGNLEKEVVRLGGKPYTPDLLEFVMKRIRKPQKAKNG